eukprot:Hpha_TRINITY_DN8312_c0_g1::TRINITY_DN8312_c0_g1_i1::g.154377::m.154377
MMAGRLVALLLLAGAAHSMVELGGTRRDRFVGHGVNHVLHHHKHALRADASNSTTYFYKDAVLDHFGSQGGAGKAWRQRYYTDETFWCGEGCPIFVYIGGEGPQGPPSHHMFMATLAEKHGALMVAVEHRFYGKSYPTPDMSNDNLRFLTSEQALADLVRLVTYLKSAPFTSGAPKDTASDPPLRLRASAQASAVVGFGGSYPGDLAAWVRLKYPQVFAGTVASSAPVYAEYNYEQYAEVVGAALKYPLIGGSGACFEQAKAGVAALRALVTSTTPMGTAPTIPEALKPCAPIASELDLSMYESVVFGNFQGTVQYNLEGRPPYVSDVCGALTNSSAGSALEALAAATALFSNMNAPFNERCVQSSWAADMIAPLRNATFDGQSAMRQWIWQSCNEFGFFQTTSGTGADQAFGAFKAVGVEHAGRLLCEQAYDLKDYEHPNTLWSNTNYGNRDMQGTRIVTPNGNMDPWHALGVVNASDPFYDTCAGATPCPKQRLAASDELVFIDGTAHCRDMYSPGVFEPIGVADTPPIVWAHSKIAAAVAQFLA